MGIPTPSSTTWPPPVPDPSLLCSPQRDGDSPSGPEGQSWVSPKHPAVLGRGGGVWGNQCAPPRLLCQCLTSWSDTPSLVPLSPKGDYSLHFYLPPKWAQPGRCIAAGPPGRTAIYAILDGVGGSGRGGYQCLWAPCGCIGDLPSAKHFPLSRSKNTKLGTLGAPHPSSPAPSLPPP